MNIYFGENLKALRMKRALTQERLAEYLGVTFQSVSKWERGECYPDITMLLTVASFFDISIDDLLGVDSIKRQKQISRYSEEFDRLFMVDNPKCFEIMKKAVKEFPNEYGLLVKYMSVLHSQANNFEAVTEEVEQVYNRIQENCTDDSIRIRAKRILINHYRCRHSREFDLKAAKIAETLPGASDCREYVSSYVFRPMGGGDNRFYTSDERHLKACQSSIETAVTMLDNSIVNYCVYDASFSLDEKISVLETCNLILKTFYTDGYYGERGLSLVYNYGHLSWISALNGNEEKALEYLKICVNEAKRLNDAPDQFVSNSLFFRGKTLEKPKRGKTCCERMKQYITEFYPFPKEFKSKKEFGEAVAMLEG